MLKIIENLTGWVVGGMRIFRVSGGSMAPALAHGDILLVNPICSRRPTPGEIVLARHPRRKDCRIVKRVAETTADGCVALRGDNGEASTDSRNFGPLPLRMILGKAILRIPLGGQRPNG